MTVIQPINLTEKRPFLRADNTGYAAIAGLALTTGTAVTKNKSVKKYHKPLAYITGALSILHLGVILNFRNKYKAQIK